MHRILLPLPGRHQSGNALLAIRVLEEAEKLGFVIPEEALKQGMAQVRWPARLEWNGRFLLDGAHNPPAMRALGAYVRSFLDEPPILLSAVMDDKDAESIAGELSAFIRAAVTVPLAEQRAMDPQTWAEHLRHHGITAYAEESLKSGLQKACELAGTGTVLCTGSLYLVGQLRDMLCMEDRPESDD